MTTSTNISQIKSLFQLQKNHAPRLNKSSADERISKMKAIKSYISDPSNEKRLVDAIHSDLRRPVVEVLVGEVVTVLQEIDFVSKNLKHWLKPKKVSTPLTLAGSSSYIYYESKGSSLVISPWNYPFQLAITPLIYSIAAGNTTILKPSEYSVATSDFLQEMLDHLFDDSEVKVVQGGVEESQALLGCPFDHMYFTGSTHVGKIVMKAAAEHLSSVTLELGGKSPCIVDETADIKSSVNSIAWGKFFNTGQTCIAPDYLLIHESKYNAFTDQLKSTIERRFNPSGKGIIHSEDLGRIISERHYVRAKSLLSDAIEKGATVIYGGDHADEERYVSPTLLTSVNDSMRVMNEEIFSPILPIIPYSNIGDIIKQTSRLPKPLALYIFSKHKNNIEEYLKNTTAGGTVINDTLIHYGNHNLPFGGVNHSGIGKSHGQYGLYAFMNERAVMHQHLGTTKMLHQPYDEKTLKTVRLMSKF
ncbi:MAG: aldehyde dehydrogenase family protein [Saprospiraceae bacterium]|nr:aldehyde dehydrogenase family protein [Saprospiraceae bacterium]